VRGKKWLSLLFFPKLFIYYADYNYKDITHYIVAIISLESMRA